MTESQTTSSKIYFHFSTIIKTYPERTSRVQIQECGLRKMLQADDGDVCTSGLWHIVEFQPESFLKTSVKPKREKKNLKISKPKSPDFQQTS